MIGIVGGLVLMCGGRNGMKNGGRNGMKNDGRKCIRNRILDKLSIPTGRQKNGERITPKNRGNFGTKRG